MVQHSNPTKPYRVPDTLLSDTEESVVGTQWHQETFYQLADMVRAVARRRGHSWGVCTQIALSGLQHEDGSDYDPMPDLMVLLQPLASLDLATVHIEEVGVPLFIAEVASNSTWGKDSGEKRRAYEAVGVSEYMALDLTGTFLKERVRAWRLVGGVYGPWKVETDGWWHSRALNIELCPGPVLMRVREQGGSEIAPTELMRQYYEEESARRREAEEQRAMEARRRQEAEEQQAVAEQQRRELEAVVLRLQAQLAEHEPQPPVE